MRHAIAAWLTHDGTQAQLILALQDDDGDVEHVAQDIDEVSYQGWLEEGLEERT